MAEKVMRALQYEGYGGGATGLKIPFTRIEVFDGEMASLQAARSAQLEVMDEKREAMAMKTKSYQMRAAKAYDKIVQHRTFKEGDLVLRIAIHVKNGTKHVVVSIPSPKKDEVLVIVEAASLNPIDWKIQKGMLRPVMPRKFPYIPVTDVAGEVVEIGSGIKLFKAGDRVVSRLNSVTGGGLAEFAVAPESLTVTRPPEVSAAEGAGLPVAGLTAHQALTKSAGIKLDGSDQPTNILITAASGGVGHYAVQLAKLGNMYITATCGARNIDFVTSLGADEVLDYKTIDGAALRSPSGRKYDFVTHCATGISWSTFEPNLSENGKVIDITPSPSGMLTFALKKLTFSKKQLVPLILTPKGENLEYLVGLVKEGKLMTVVDSKHPLSKAEEAWAKSIDGHATGKIIVELTKTMLEFA
ncbi:hypothetical protein HHK36_022255 [Tetracentron sinense]|uniref:Enoyl reductase (ER) domain-containing protein n=1 Tax=Tetracentron sinense TaxID=13715 RepID=A0A834YQH5_TETSI|nr:hypothetical protein HHK36_022255 [Tetracentron sinense]